MPTVVKIIGLATGQRTELDGKYLTAYDPDANLGYGEVSGSKDIAQAIRFADMGEAIDYVKQVSKTNPVRPDGKPNRPITAFHLEFTNVS